MEYLITAILIVFILIFFYYENNILHINKLKVKLNVENPFKIIHLSDIHSKEFGVDNKKLIKKMKKLKPDLIVITGDLINTDGKNIEKMITLLKKLDSIAKVYYILGNHEHRLKGLNEIINRLKDLKISVLINEIDSIVIKGNKINILGLDENQASRDDYKKRKKGIYEYKDYSNLFNKLELEDGIKIVLSHYPENFSLIGEMSYKNYDFDLMLSGHAHGGQFRFPFIGGLYAPGQGILPKYTGGLYKEKNTLIVSRGLGPSRFPLRLFNRPEIVSIDIR